MNDRRAFAAGAVFGIAGTALLLGLTITHLPPRSSHGPRIFAASYGRETSEAARAIAASIAPGLQSAARDHQHEFVARAGGPVVRFAAREVYPVIVREIPTGVEITSDELLSHFGSLTMADLVKMIVEHNRAKGRTVHPSLQRFQAPR